MTVLARTTPALALFLVLLAGNAQAENFFRTPSFQGLSSLVVPGTGQFFQKNWSHGAAHMSVWGVSITAAAYYAEQDDFLTDEERFDDDLERQYYNDTTLKYDIFALLATDTAFYSSFAAYRDGREMRSNEGYSTPAPTESLADLTKSPFQWKYLKRPTTFIPIAVSVVALASIDAGDPDDGFYEVYYTDDVNKGLLYGYAFGVGMGPAVGEEAFFRGFLNNQFSHKFGRWWGLGLSSGIFALGHSGQGNQASALSAGLFGLYTGWLQQHNDYAIGEGVAIHFWGNFLASATAIANGGSAELMRIGFEF